MSSSTSPALAYPDRTELRMCSLLIPSIFGIALNNPRWTQILQRYTRLWPLYLGSAIILVTAIHYSVHRYGVQSEIVVAAFVPIFLPTLLSLLLLSTTLHTGSSLCRFLELPSVRFVGRISYSIYLWQQIFEGFLRPSWFPLRMLCIVAVAYGSYRFIERPMIHIGHRFFPPANVQAKAAALTFAPEESTGI